MKTFTAAALTVGACLSAYSQGAIDFRNGTGQLPEPPDRTVRFADGTPVVGTQFLAQLFYSSDAPTADTGLDASAAVYEAATAFRGDMLAPGRWSQSPIGGARTLTHTDMGETALLVVRVWDSTHGAYSDAVAAGGIFGQSASFEYTVPSSPIAPPYEFFMLNFQGFTLLPVITTIPEPSTRFLILFGSLATLAFRQWYPRHHSG
jgi:hypothetical protein